MSKTLMLIGRGIVIVLAFIVGLNLADYVVDKYI